MQLSWVPYRWRPVIHEGRPFRVTFLVKHGETLQGLVAVFKTPTREARFPFTIAEGSAELWLDEAQVAAIKDRALAQIIVDTGAGWETLAEGYATKVR